MGVFWDNDPNRAPQAAQGKRPLMAGGWGREICIHMLDALVGGWDAGICIYMLDALVWRRGPGICMYVVDIVLAERWRDPCVCQMCRHMYISALDNLVWRLGPREMPVLDVLLSTNSPQACNHRSPHGISTATAPAQAPQRQTYGQIIGRGDAIDTKRPLQTTDGRELLFVLVGAVLHVADIIEDQPRL